MIGREKFIFCTRVHSLLWKKDNWKRKKLIKCIQSVHFSVKKATKGLQGDALRDAQFRFRIFAKIACQNTKKFSQTFLWKSWRKLTNDDFFFRLIQKGKILQRYLYSLKFSRKQEVYYTYTKQKAENLAPHFNEVGWKQLNFFKNKGEHFVSTLPSSTVSIYYSNYSITCHSEIPVHFAILRIKQDSENWERINSTCRVKTYCLCNNR